jgi:hypothetical protein
MFSVTAAALAGGRRRRSRRGMREDEENLGENVEMGLEPEK